VTKEQKENRTRSGYTMQKMSYFNLKKKRVEKELVQKAREKRKKADCLEYKLLFQMIATRIEMV
jgi:hypothetical protein